MCIMLMSCVLEVIDVFMYASSIEYFEYDFEYMHNETGREFLFYFFEKIYHNFFKYQTTNLIIM